MHKRMLNNLHSLALGVVLLIGPSPVSASSLTVPDDAPTIQAALDAGVDTVIVRPGSYAETPITHGSVSLLGLTEGSSARPVLAGLRIPAEFWGNYHFQHLRLNRLVITDTDHQSVGLRFVDCEFPGIVDSTGLGGIDGISLARCLVTGAIPLSRDYSYVTVDTCPLTGGVNAVSPRVSVVL